MKTILLFTMLLTLLNNTTEAQEGPVTYKLVVSFGSECCGTPSEKALVASIDSLKKEYGKICIAAERYAPIGREGEYMVGFQLKELGKKQRANFIKTIKSIQKLPDEPGYFTFEENKVIDITTLPQRTKRTNINY